MSLEYIIVLCFVEAIIVFMVLYLFFKSSKKTDMQKLEKLQASIELLKEKLSQKEQMIENLTSSKNQTSFVSAEIKKREVLEEKIEKLYRIIEDTKNIARDATMMKSDFLSNIRHEIRTPLNSILVFAQLLYKEIQDKRLRAFANDIMSSGSKLLVMLDNIIELSKIKSDTLKIKESAVDIRDFFKLNIDAFRPDIAKKGLDLKIIIDEDMPKSLMIDKVRVSDIFTNLLSNALKFTQKGYIKIIIKVDNVNVVNNVIDILIAIEDSGVGISKANQQKIFEIFETKEDGDEVEYQGRGVELSVNRKLAQLMNGDLFVKSELSKGSIFTLKLKDVEVVLSNDNTQSGNINVDFSLISPENPATILVVDDTKESCNIVEECFSHTDTKILTFDNSRDAIGVLKKQKVDLIFIDIDMLSIDDGAVSKVIRTVSEAFVVTLTDKRVKDVVFVDAGVKPVGHLKKPISKIELFKITLKLLNAQDGVVVKKANFQKDKTSKNVLDKLDKFDTQDLQQFLKAQEIILTKLYKEAISTNDLNAIKVFSTSLLELSLKHRIQDMVEYAKVLLKKIDSFEINDINEMLINYKLKIEEFEKKVKD
jgi:signal transduction histidine kinase/DNA-binding response OmpR family regulator